MTSTRSELGPLDTESHLTTYRPSLRSFGRPQTLSTLAGMVFEKKTGLKFIGQKTLCNLKSFSGYQLYNHNKTPELG